MEEKEEEKEEKREEIDDQFKGKEIQWMRRLEQEELDWYLPSSVLPVRSFWFVSLRGWWVRRFFPNLWSSTFIVNHIKS